MTEAVYEAPMASTNIRRHSEVWCHTRTPTLLLGKVSEVPAHAVRQEKSHLHQTGRSKMISVCR